MHSAKILYSTISEVTHTKMKCSYHFSENWIPAVVGTGKWKLAAVLQVILQKDKYLIYPFALGLKNVIFFQAVKVLQFSILCFPISHSNTVCYSHRPLSGQILHKPCYHSMQIFLPFYWPRAHNGTCKWLPSNNSLLMRNDVQLCLATNDILLMRKWNHVFLLLAIAPAWNWQIASQIIEKQPPWSSNKRIMTLGYRKISWFFSVSHIIIFCETSSSNF